MTHVRNKMRQPTNLEETPSTAKFSSISPLRSLPVYADTVTYGPTYKRYSFWFSNRTTYAVEPYPRSCSLQQFQDAPNQFALENGTQSSTTTEDKLQYHKCTKILYDYICVLKNVLANQKQLASQQVWHTSKNKWRYKGLSPKTNFLQSNSLCSLTINANLWIASNLTKVLIKLNDKWDNKQYSFD